MTTNTKGIITDFNKFDDTANSIIVQADGKLVVAGSSGLYGSYNYDFALARYNVNGSLDTSFDGDGKVTTDFGSDWDFASSVIVQTDGKLVVTGQFNNGRNDDFALARYNTDGSLDTTFDGDGKVTTNFSSDTDYADAVIAQADGKLVVVGV